MINKVHAVYFSGTGTTEKMCRHLAKNISEKLGTAYDEYDFTPLKAREKKLSFNESDLVVLGTPVIAGRVPNLLLKYLESIEGNNALGISVVLYGNRNFDDALVELRNIMEDDGFLTVAGGAFVGEHSFSKILGAGRPDDDDMKDADSFSEAVCELLEKGETDIRKDHVPVEVEGNNPPGPYYKPKDKNGEHINILKVVPKTSDACTNCGKCAELCPMGSIDPDDCTKMIGKCMKCSACIKKCPENAKYYDDEGLIIHKEDLEERFGPVRGENKWFVKTI